MSGSSREMTLDEWVEPLHEGHRVRQELAALRETLDKAKNITEDALNLHEPIADLGATLGHCFQQFNNENAALRDEVARLRGGAEKFAELKKLVDQMMPILLQTGGSPPPGGSEVALPYYAWLVREKIDKWRLTCAARACLTALAPAPAAEKPAVGRANDGK